MDTSLRRRFTSPFSMSRTTERSKLNRTPSSWQQEQFSVPSPTPRLPSGIQVSKLDSIMSSGRSQEKGFESLNQISESTTERGPRQKVCRSLFSSKPRSLEQQSHLEQISHLKQQFQPEKEQIYKRDSMFRSDFLGADKIGTLISLVELPVPEILPEAINMDTADVHIMLEELLGRYAEVKLLQPSDFCQLLKPEAVEKFKLAISPSKVGLAHFPRLLCSSTKSIFDDLDFGGSGLQAKRLLEIKEKLVQVPSSGKSKSSDLLTDKRRMIGVPKRKEHSVQAPSLGDSIFSDSSTGKKRMIKGFSVPRCGRLNNQSYQEQAKEFQEILSSKVRQIAEVADCLQHKELLYRILQF